MGRGRLARIGALGAASLAMVALAAAPARPYPDSAADRVLECRRLALPDLDCAAFAAAGPVEACRMLVARSRPAEGRLVSCAVVGEVTADPSATVPAGVLPVGVPVPTDLAVDGRPGCVTGPGRPVVATTGPVLSARFVGAPSAGATFEWRESTEADSTFSTAEGGAAELDLDLTDLGPGLIYRWRVRGTPDDAAVPAWSDWCEFAVAAGRPDLREVEDPDAVLELGVTPGRDYAVRLTVRRWRLLLEALEPGDVEDPLAEEPDETVKIASLVRGKVRGVPAGRSVVITLTGERWAVAESALAGWASAADETAEEMSDEDDVEDGAAYWKVVDLISVGLGGPAHPGLGIR